MSKKNDKNPLDLIAAEARESFDLGDFLRGRSMRTKTVRVFTDEVTAEQRGGYETTTKTLPSGAVVPDVRSWGLVGQIADAQTEYERLESKTTKAGKALKARIDSLSAEIEVLTARLLESALEIELRAIPDVVKKDTYRAAKKALGINGKVSEDKTPDLLDEHAAQILFRSVVSITRRQDGSRNEGISIEAARTMRGFLPDSEWAKIDKALSDLLFENVISEQVVSDTDF